jgi:hypothetical protein
VRQIWNLEQYFPSRVLDWPQHKARLNAKPSYFRPCLFFLVDRLWRWAAQIEAADLRSILSYLSGIAQPLAALPFSVDVFANALERHRVEQLLGVVSSLKKERDCDLPYKFRFLDKILEACWRVPAAGRNESAKFHGRFKEIAWESVSKLIENECKLLL